MQTMDRTWFGRVVLLGLVAALGACGGVSPAGTGNDGAAGSMAAGGRGGTLRRERRCWSGAGTTGVAGTTGIAGTTGVAGASGTGGGAAGRGGAGGTTGVARAARRDEVGPAARRVSRAPVVARRDAVAQAASPVPRALPGAAAARAAPPARAALARARRSTASGTRVLQRCVREPAERSVQLRRLRQALRRQHAVLRRWRTCQGALRSATRLRGDGCCGNICCGAGQMCCEDQGPVGGRAPTCHTPTADQPTCPQGCAPLCVSDRNKKKDITPADTTPCCRRSASCRSRRGLKTASRPGSATWDRWRRTSGPASASGDDDRTYNAVDAHGVALAAIQALEKRVADQGKRIERLERENRRLRSGLQSRDR